MPDASHRRREVPVMDLGTGQGDTAGPASVFGCVLLAPQEEGIKMSVSDSQEGSH